MLKQFFKRLFCLGILIILGVTNNAFAQNTSYEFWPESDIWYRLNSSWRLSSFIAITKYNETKYRDLTVLIQADYGWGKTKHPFYKRLFDEKRAQTVKAWLLRGGYMGGLSLGENAGSYTEDMLFSEIHRRFPVKGKILISHRLRTDIRWVGEPAKLSYRFRYRLMVEKEYEAGKSSLVPYVNIEPYWDSRYSEINRVRIIGGITVSRGKHFAYEGNITYQYDSHYDTNNLFAFNIILHLFFERKNTKPKTGSINNPMNMKLCDNNR